MPNNNYIITYLGTERISVAKIRPSIYPSLEIAQTIASSRSKRTIKASSSSDVLEGSLYECAGLGGGAWTGGGRPRKIRNGRFDLQIPHARRIGGTFGNK